VLSCSIACIMTYLVVLTEHEQWLVRERDETHRLKHRVITHNHTSMA